MDTWLHFRWAPGVDRPVVFSAHHTEVSARLDCPVNILDPDDADAGVDAWDRWVLEGVTLLRPGNVPFWEALEDHVALAKAVDATEPS